MAGYSGTFIDDERLRPRDNSGGPMGPTYNGDFGDGGKVTGGEPANSRPDEDEMKGGSMGQGGTMKNPKRVDRGY